MTRLFIFLVWCLSSVYCNRNNPVSPPDISTTVPVSPENGAITDHFSPSFSWQAVDGALGYHFQLDKDSTFSAPLVDSTGIQNNTYLCRDTLPNDAYFWRVRVQHTNGVWSSWSVVYELKIAWSPGARIAVFADPHVYDPSLGIAGPAFENYVSRDRKMIAESKAILEAVISAVGNTQPDIVLIPGDLTKDGELASHQLVAAALGRLEDTGAQVFVVPGNHDVANPNAFQYAGETAAPAANITAGDFENIYRDFGYDQALSRDPGSLSYVAEPVYGLWILAMDPCRYKENTDHAVTGGAFSSETLGWIYDRLRQARELNKQVLGMMHHGVIEHFEGQSFLFPDFVVNNWHVLCPAFADSGMHLVFTGHFHAQDIVKKETASSFIFDIETGSTVTWPCPWRLMTLSGRTLTISSRFIGEIDADTGSLSFPEYARACLVSGVEAIILDVLTENLGMTAASAGPLVPFLSEAVMAHFAGDEVMPQETAAFIEQLTSGGDLYEMLAGNALNAIYDDPPPADNDIEIDLQTGVVSL